MAKDGVVEVMTVGLEAILQKVARQASDPGLWFEAQSASEAYLQQELRYLHAIIETVLGSEEVNPMKRPPPFWALLEESGWGEQPTEPKEV